MDENKESYKKEKERVGAPKDAIDYYDASNTFKRIDDMRETGRNLKNDPAPKAVPGNSGRLDTQLFPGRDIVKKYEEQRNRSEKKT